MNRYFVIGGPALMLVIGVAGFASVRAQQQAPQGNTIAPPVAALPYQTGILIPVAPAQMPAEDAERLLQRLGVPAAPAPAASPSSSATPGTGGGVSRTITVAAPPVVNQSSQFQFRTVNGGSPGAESEKLSLAERQAAVEGYRQSLVKGGGIRP